jgi:AraC-like DNA-binding protein
MTIVNSIDFTIEIGYDSLQFEPFFRLLTTLTLMNVFILVGRNKISKIIFTTEIILSIIYFIAILSSSNHITIKNDTLILNNKLFKIINLYVNIIFIGNILYSLILLYYRNDTTNLYHRKIKQWVFILFIFFLIVILIIIVKVISDKLNQPILYSDTKLSLIILRFFSIIFILFRPKFIDEIGIPFSKNLFNRKSGTILPNRDFEFVFFSNHYYLNQAANLEDLALKLNHSKSEITAYIKTLDEGNLNDLLNKYRVIYFTELLKNKKYESLTIEALSEISGFGSRKTMYNAFNKYHGMTPTEFINIHK